MVREVGHLRTQRLRRLSRAGEAALFLQPRREVLMRVPESAVVRVDQEPNHLLVDLLRKKRTGALVVEADTVTLPLFALNQTALPRWVGLPHVVPSETGEVATAE